MKKKPQSKEGFHGHVSGGAEGEVVRLYVRRQAMLVRLGRHRQAVRVRQEEGRREAKGQRQGRKMRLPAQRRAVRAKAGGKGMACARKHKARFCRQKCSAAA